jgi:hypothetical protein
MLIASTGSGSINISESEKRWFRVCKKKLGLLVQVIILISKKLLGFMKEATKEPAFFWVIN